VRSYARRAAATASSTSAWFALEISAMRSSLEGEMVWNGVPRPSTNSPPMKRP
jgi:hypothetical protein